MVRNRRLSSEERKKEIMNSAADFFIKKGFQQTTMEDVISGTSLSKGGVYHYYKNTVDILRDLMIEGHNYRIYVIKESIKKYNHEDDITFLAEEIVKKIIDDNKFMPVYVDFLIAKKRNKKLYDLYEDLEKNLREEYINLNGIENRKLKEIVTDRFIMNLINSLIIGAEVLDARESFKDCKEILVSIVKTYIEKMIEK